MSEHAAESEAPARGVCDCDYWHSKHRWHCATNYPARPIPPAETAELRERLRPVAAREGEGR